MKKVNISNCFLTLYADGYGQITRTPKRGKYEFSLALGGVPCVRVITSTGRMIDFHTKALKLTNKPQRFMRMLDWEETGEVICGVQKVEPSHISEM